MICKYCGDEMIADDEGNYYCTFCHASCEQKLKLVWIWEEEDRQEI